jgi:hypothetical protein
MSKQKDTMATTNPRFAYRTPKKDKDNIEGRIKLILAKLNKNSEDYYCHNQNDLFLEAIYRGLVELEKSKLTPEDAYYQIEFEERPEERKNVKKA